MYAGELAEIEGLENQITHTTIVNEAEEHSRGHKNINENLPDRKLFACVGDRSIYKEVSGFRWSHIASRLLDILEPTLKGQS